MAHDHQTRKGDGLWYWATKHKVAWLFDDMIIYSLMKNKKTYLQFQISYGHQTWQGSGLWHETNTQQITSLLVKTYFHS